MQRRRTARGPGRRPLTRSTGGLRRFVRLHPHWDRPGRAVGLPGLRISARHPEDENFPIRTLRGDTFAFPHDVALQAFGRLGLLTGERNRRFAVREYPRPTLSLCGRSLSRVALDSGMFGKPAAAPTVAGFFSSVAVGRNQGLTNRSNPTRKYAEPRAKNRGPN